MANVVRFVLESQRNLDVPGAGRFIAGVLDVPAMNLERVNLVRFLVPPFGGKEYGTVDSASTAPTLPATPLPPPADPLPMYALDSEVGALAAASPEVRAAFESRGVPLNFDGQGLVFDRANSGAPVFTLAAQNPVGGATPAPSLYWMWIIDARKILGAPALDEFYMYYSTDHAAVHADSGIWLATGPTELGPWTTRGRVYRDDSGGNQTETPTVIPDPTGQTALVMLYQQAGVPTATGQQSTMWATSNDGIAWTRGGIAIDIPSSWPSDGHTGYARTTAVGNQIVAHHLAGGGNNPKFGMSVSYDARNWTLDPQPLYYGLDQMTDGRRIEWNAGDIISWRGQLWWVGIVSNFTSGGGAKDARIAVAPIAPNLRNLLAPPRYVLNPVAGAETVNVRSTRTFVARDGRIVLYYQTDNNFFAAIARKAA